MNENRTAAAAAGAVLGMAAAFAVWRMTEPSWHMGSRARKIKKAAARTLESMGDVASELSSWAR